MTAQHRPATRQQRQQAVLCYALSLLMWLLTAAALHLTPVLPGDLRNAFLVPAALGVLFGGYAMLRLGADPAQGGLRLPRPTEEGSIDHLDEWERQRVMTAHLRAHRLYAFVAFLALLASIVTDGLLLTWPLLLAAYLLLRFLPTATLAWTEPDPLAD